MVNKCFQISAVTLKRVPTLFSTVHEKIVLATLILICGFSVEDGFGLSYRIMTEMSLKNENVYFLTAKYLSSNDRLNEIEKLVECINYNNHQKDKKLCDEILKLAIQTAMQYRQRNTDASIKSKEIDNLIKLITDVPTKIDCYILANQLKSAYLLAVTHKDVRSIKRLLSFAEKSGNMQIKKLCEKKLSNLNE